MAVNCDKVTFEPDSNPLPMGLCHENGTIEPTGPNAQLYVRIYVEVDIEPKTTLVKSVRRIQKFCYL